MKNCKYFAFIFVLFFTFEILYVETLYARQRIMRRSRPAEVKIETSKVPTAPQSRTHSVRSRNFDPHQNSVRSNSRPSVEISRDALERLGINESRIENVESSLNREQNRRFRRSISSLDQYVQNTGRNSQTQLVEILIEAVLLNPTHSFIRQAIRMLGAGQITSSEQASNIITVLAEARSFMRRRDTTTMDILSRTLLRNDHTNNLNRALFRSGYSREQNRGWCI